ncbi:MAG: hypothetical protein HY751_07770 [Nitrospinae bacterium]|nr:hypothetical protein [Nitrospinota bacterium]
MLRVILAAFFLILAAVIPAGAADNGKDPSLDGLKILMVVADPVDAELEGLGFTSEWVQSAVEEKLKTAGLHVASAEAGIRLGAGIKLKRHGAPYLNVTVDTPSQGAEHSYLIHLALRQDAKLVRNSALIRSIPTWVLDIRVKAGQTGLVEAMKARTLEGVEKFISAWKNSNK